MPKNDFDVIIIGGGVAASVAAYNLSKSNLKIACFEQGGYEKNYANYKSKKLSFFDNIKIRMYEAIYANRFGDILDSTLKLNSTL